MKEAHFEGCCSTQSVGFHASWAPTFGAECLLMGIPEVLDGVLVDVGLVLDGL